MLHEAAEKEALFVPFLKLSLLISFKFNSSSKVNSIGKNKFTHLSRSTNNNHTRQKHNPLLSSSPCLDSCANSVDPNQFHFYNTLLTFVRNA